MSWNPVPIYGSAQWNGNQQLATKNQLISSINGIYTDLQDLSGFTFSNLEVSTLTVKNWISAPTLYVSSLYAQNIDLSGIILDPSGVFIVTDLSANKCSISFVSMSTLQFNYTMNNNLNVTFDLGLGDAIGGLAAGLGFLVGGAFIGIGTAIGGTAQGIATLIAGRPQNFITNNTYETINFTSQLQISTIGYAQPIYSTIFRTVSSVSANEVPGLEIFTSSFFYPGQICIRTASDPFNLISGNSNLNTSSIQSFGQWTPLIGLEPENIVANGVVANTISTGDFFATLAKTDLLESYTVVTSNLGVSQNASFAYDALLEFQTGSTNGAGFKGYLNNLYCYNNTGYIFSGAGGTQESASFYLGQNTNESLLNVSSIYARGNIQANSAFISTLTVETLYVISTINLTSTSQEVITSTQTLEADTAYINNAYISTMAPFQFVSQLGNPFGKFDITKVDSVISTQYTNISSQTQNILSYTLNATINDQTIIYPYSATAGTYTVSPNNVGQWASTMIYCSPGVDITVLLNMTYPSSFTQANLTGQFDFTVDMTTHAFGVGAGQLSTTDPNQPYITSFFATSPTPGYFNTYRFTLAPTGLWSVASPAPPAPTTQNSNVFTISQNITDTYIRATDRLHLQAGDILLDGTLNVPLINIDRLNVDYVNAIQISPFIQTNSTWGPGSIPPNMIELDYSANIGSVSSLTSTNMQIMTTAQAGYINNYTSQISTIVDRPVYNLSFGTGNSLWLGPLGATGINGGAGNYNRPDINWAFGTINFAAGDNSFTINIANYGNIAVNGAVLNLSNTGSFLGTLTVQGVAGSTPLGPGVGCTILWNQTVFQPPTIYTPWTPYVITDDFQINQSYNRVQIETNLAQFTGGITVASNAVIDGAVRFGGQFTTYVPSGGYAAIELYTQNETTIIWGLIGGSGATWESASQNLIPRAVGGYYKSSDWDAFVSVGGFTTPDYSSQLNTFTATIVNEVVGGVNYLAIYRYLALIHVGSPSSGSFTVNVMLIPKNLTT